MRKNKAKRGQRIHCVLWVSQGDICVKAVALQLIRQLAVSLIIRMGTTLPDTVRLNVLMAFLFTPVLYVNHGNERGC